MRQELGLDGLKPHAVCAILPTKAFACSCIFLTAAYLLASKHASCLPLLCFACLSCELSHCLSTMSTY